MSLICTLMVGGIIGNILAGIIGAWLGSMILGEREPELGDFVIIPALIGSVIIVLFFSFILGTARR